MTDFLENGRTGYVIKLNDQQTFMENCKKLIGNAVLRKTFAEYNLGIVEDYFIENCAKMYEDLFQKVIEEKKL